MPAEILILGGGFAGLTTARKLERLLRPEEAAITVVSRENFSVFTPMLPEVSSGNLEARHVATPLRAQLRRARFVLADVRSLDLEQRTVVVEHALLGTEMRLSYDQLVLSVGAVTSTFNLPGVAEHALPLKTLEDADRLRNHVIAMLELADVANDALERKRLLTFVFVGGGFTGVEAAGEMVDFFRSITKFYRSIGPHEIEVILVEGGAKLLPDLQAGMGEYSARELERRGVVVMLNALVDSADARGLTLKDGRRIEANTIVWSAGVRPSPFVGGLSIGTGRGGSIRTNPDMSVPGQPGVWAIGDCASIPDPHGGTYAATAQYAIREGPVLAANIVATLRGKPTKPFRYEAIGIMASLGARRAVAGLRGKYLITGFLAWFLWRTYYLARLPGLDRRFRVTLDWTLGLIFPRDIAELRVYTKAAQQRSALDAGIAAPPESETSVGA